jgi:hypothetical protein
VRTGPADASLASLRAERGNIQAGIATPLAIVGGTRVRDRGVASIGAVRRSGAGGLELHQPRGCREFIDGDPFILSTASSAAGDPGMGRNVWRQDALWLFALYHDAWTR